MAPKSNALPQWLAADHRTAARWPIDLPAELAVRDRPGAAAVRVGDISALGCLLVVADETVAVGRFVTVTLPGHAPLEGWIAWCKQGHAGVDFAQPLDEAKVDEIIAGWVYPSRHPG